MKRSLLLLTAAILVSCSFAGKRPGNNPVNIQSVPTEAGLVSGITGSDGSVKIFKGIPFAAPPIGELRWAPPADVIPWKGVRKCEAFAASAMQAKPQPFSMWTKEFMAPEEPLSEDCLYLNLWTAAKNTQDKKPVIVWIHGGAFTGGSGSVPLYDGEQMAKKGVVFITINYRLGIFGFLAHPELSRESPDKTSGNYGILDQIAALNWVKKNVAEFGGDPENVTIAGQSAGAFSVNALVVSPLARGLFHRAIAQSGGMFGRDRLSGSDLKTAEEAGLRLTQSLKVTSIDELRSMPAETLMKAGFRSGVIFDNHVISSAYEAFNKSEQNNVPLLTGWNADEFFFGQPMNAKAFSADAEKKYGELAPAFLKAFPAGTEEEAAASQKLMSSLSFGWQNYCWASLQSTKTNNKAYLYYFTRVPPGLPDFGAFHSAEFGYALNTLKFWDRPFTEWDYRLTEMMSSYWINFASTGNPNGDGLPEWPSYNPDSSKVMEFGTEVKTIDLPFKEQLRFLDQYQGVEY